VRKKKDPKGHVSYGAPALYHTSKHVEREASKRARKSIYDLFTEDNIGHMEKNLKIIEK
jgi:hypothetical protein